MFKITVKKGNKVIKEKICNYETTKAIQQKAIDNIWQWTERWTKESMLANQDQWPWSVNHPSKGTKLVITKIDDN